MAFRALGLVSVSAARRRLKAGAAKEAGAAKAPREAGAASAGFHMSCAVQLSFRDRRAAGRVRPHK